MKRLKNFILKLIDKYKRWRLERRIASGAMNLELAVKKKEREEMAQRLGLVSFLRRKLKIRRLTEHQLARLSAAKSSGKYTVKNNKLVKG